MFVGALSPIFLLIEDDLDQLKEAAENEALA
jgi:hypothetical protein